MENPRSVFRVTPKASFWLVRRDGTSDGPSVFARKDQAIDLAIIRARIHAPSQLLIHTRDGSVEAERAFDRDEDAPAPEDAPSATGPGFLGRIGWTWPTLFGRGRSLGDARATLLKRKFG